MPTFAHFFFYVGFCLLLVHEMDAVKRREWRVFPGMSMLPDQTGFYVFMLVHVPLYLWFLWGLQTNAAAWIRGLDVFFIAHVGLHLAFMRHRNYEFNNWFSWLLIAGAGLAGAVDFWG